MHNAPGQTERERPLVGEGPGLGIRIQIPETRQSSYGHPHQTQQQHHPPMHLDDLPSVRLLAPPSSEHARTPPPFSQHQHHLPGPSHADALEQHQLLLPSIHVHAATPSPVSMHHPSPSPSPTAASGGGGRKQRFTMGPRADCEKCRAGVRGHWMHFD